MNKCDAEEATRDVFLTMVGQGGPVPVEPGASLLDLPDLREHLPDAAAQGPTDGIRPDRGISCPSSPGEGAHARPVEDWSREVERRFPERKLGQVIDGFTAALPEEFLVVFALRDVQGLSYEETAQVLNLTIAQVKSRFFLARLCLRERLGRYLRTREQTEGFLTEEPIALSPLRRRIDGPAADHPQGRRLAFLRRISFPAQRTTTRLFMIIRMTRTRITRTANPIRKPTPLSDPAATRSAREASRCRSLSLIDRILAMASSEETP